MIKYKFAGYTPNDEILAFYANYTPDCFITTSETEGLPISVVEAMDLGLPIVVTDVGGMRELVDGNGLLLPSNPTAEEVASAIVSIMDCNEDTRNEMKLNGKKIWSSRFDAVLNAKEFANYIADVCKDGTQKVVLITERYPFGGEQTFIETELREMLKRFDVSLICYNIDNSSGDKECQASINIDRVLKDQDGEIHNLEVIKNSDNWKTGHCVRYFFDYILDRNIKEERKSIWRTNKKRMIRFWESLKYYSKAEEFLKNTLLDVIDNCDLSRTVIYTYWHQPYTLAACLLKASGRNLKVITREHGFDLYDERVKKSIRQPFREMMDNYLESVIFACKIGKQYYLDRNHFGCNDEKYRVHYIGSRHYNDMLNVITNERNTKIIEGGDGQGTSQKPFKIVSCSALIPLKRVNLIIDALNVINKTRPSTNIEWIHFGDGELLQPMQTYACVKLGGQ